MDHNPSASRSLGIPTEVWVMVFEYLGLQDMKQFRLANHECRVIATPLCFETVTFEMSEASVRNLIDVASNEGLARHVRTLVLERRKRIRRFSDCNEWEGAISLPDDPNITLSPFDDSDGEDDTYDGMMSYLDWSRCSDAERSTLYLQYENDRMAANDNIASLSEQLYFRRVGCTYSEQVRLLNRSSSMREECIIKRLDEALAKFTQLTVFKHRPTVLLRDRWVTHWQRLRIDAYDFDSDSYDKDCEEDDDMEALQLSCALRALGWAKQYLTNLNSMVFHVEGPAFWGPRRLRRLWQGEGHGEVRKLRKLYDDAVVADVDAEPIPADLIRDDEYVRQLVIMENALGELTHLDCSVSEDEENGGLFMAARFLFEFLCCGKNLKRLRLTFGWLVDGHLQSDHWLRENGDGPKELLTLLTNYTPWSKIEELKLEIATDEPTLLRFLVSLQLTLRSLTLSTVTLAPSSGTWDSALPRIASSLKQLRQLDLSALCDYPQHRRQRLLFDPQAEIWAGKSTCYNEYRKSMIDHLLHAKKLHQLEPRMFMEEHSQICKHK
jgi:hypothetical protein